MIKPEVLSRDDQVVRLAVVFDAPLVVLPDLSLVPAAEVAASVGLTYWLKHRHPGWSWRHLTAGGVLLMLVTLGSEWAHNLAHALVAKRIGKPVDAIRVVFGMPLLVYHDLHDPAVTPRQHILRASGGPLLNLVLIPLARLWQKHTLPGTVWRDAAEAALATNVFLLAAGLLPIPGLDGGAILKWTLIGGGQTIPQADRSVRKANLITGAGLAAGSALSLKKRKWWIGGVLGGMAALSLIVGKGWLKES